MLICPSLMCANFDNLKQETMNLDAAGTDIFHIDIMDGSFVPNFAMGLQDLKTVRKYTDKYIDVHLMINNPGQYIDLFIDNGADIIYIHPESEKYVSKTIASIKNRKKLAGLAINPDTSLSTIEELIPLVDYILVMTVNPGFAGQDFLDFVYSKIDRLIELKLNYNFKIVVDGAISPTKVKDLSSKGVDGFVLGTSTLFNKKGSYESIINDLRKYKK